MMEARIIDAAHQADINLPNQPFPLWGRMVVSRQDGQWSQTVEKLPAKEVRKMCFPDENYDFAEMGKNHTFIGAYDGETCVGLAVMEEHFFSYMYLLDLKVDGAYRGQGVGALLIEKAKEVARAKTTGASSPRARTTTPRRACSTSSRGSASAGWIQRSTRAPPRRGRRISCFIWIFERTKSQSSGISGDWLFSLKNS